MRADEREPIIAIMRRTPNAIVRRSPARWRDHAGESPPATDVPANAMTDWTAEDAVSDLGVLPAMHQAARAVSCARGEWRTPRRIPSSGRACAPRGTR